MDDIVIARALHMLAVVHWIGGVPFVTLIVLPLARSRPAAEAMTQFTAFEQRFASQVRISLPLAGATGLWMTYRMNLWDRFADPRFWWMSGMFGIWLVFMLIVFVFELLLHDRFEREARRAPPGDFAQHGRSSRSPAPACSNNRARRGRGSARVQLLLKTKSTRMRSASNKS